MNTFEQNDIFAKFLLHKRRFHFIRNGILRIKTSFFDKLNAEQIFMIESENVMFVQNDNNRCLFALRINFENCLSLYDTYFCILKLFE